MGTRTRITLLLLACASACWSPRSHAATLHVDGASTCSPADGSPACPFTLIQDAIGAASAGDQVEVLPGVYLEWIFMKNGVDVVSRDGPLVTTIDATGQNNTAVRFSNTSTTSTLVTRLSGFTITGGVGRTRPEASRGGAGAARAGGGVFIYNRNQSVVTPILDDNIITGNRLDSQDFVQYPYRLGGGIYVSVGRPSISHSIITENSALDTRFGLLGYGGGIYGTHYTRPQIVGNTISRNDADSGGGISLAGGPSANNVPRIDANLIQENSAGGEGGAIQARFLGRFEVTNNVIHGNQAGIGGALHVYFASVTVNNNTMVANTAIRTGGIYIGSGGSGDSVSITNNVIAGNVSTESQYTYGGGLDEKPGTSTTISFRFNDLVDNLPVDWGGVDPGGFPGNLSASPAFVDEVALDFRLASGSPGIDAGDDLAAPPFDIAGLPRPLDGDGDASPVADMGAHESVLDSDLDGVPDDGDLSGTTGDAPCTGGEVLGCDDNCPGETNPAQSDLDGDAMGDACDPDLDGDAVANANDCAPYDPSAAAPPAGIGMSLALAADGSTLSWAVDPEATGYSVLRGEVLPASAFAYDYGCLAQTASTSYPDLDVPAAHVLLYYVISSWNACGAFGPGVDSAGAPRPSPVGCP